MLSAYGTLENAFDHAQTDLKGKQREKMLEGRASGLMSKKIATITRHVPLDEVSLEDCRLGDMSGAMDLFEKLGLRTLMRAFPICRRSRRLKSRSFPGKRRPCLTAKRPSPPGSPRCPPPCASAC